MSAPASSRRAFAARGRHRSLLQRSLDHRRCRRAGKGGAARRDRCVYDNNSSDDTGEVARAAGAIVANERYQGKGNVVRRMFADIDADIYVMVDGDNTYDLEAAPGTDCGDARAVARFRQRRAGRY